MPRELLSQKEYEVAVHVAKGLKNADIANELHISKRSVESHVHNILKKLDVKTRCHLTYLFYTDLSVHQKKQSLKRTAKNILNKKFDNICTYPMLPQELTEKANCSFTTAYKELKKRGLLIKAGILIVYKDKIWTISELAIAHNLPEPVIRQRIFTLGWSVEKTLTMEVRLKS